MMFAAATGQTVYYVVHTSAMRYLARCLLHQMAVPELQDAALNRVKIITVEDRQYDHHSRRVYGVRPEHVFIDHAAGD